MFVCFVELLLLLSTVLALQPAENVVNVERIDRIRTDVMVCCEEINQNGVSEAIN
jgi:hypothetical protein